MQYKKRSASTIQLLQHGAGTSGFVVPLVHCLFITLCLA